MSGSLVIAALGYKALILMYIWLGSAIVGASLSRSKGYGEKWGLGTGMLLTVLGPIIWLFVPPKDQNAEWHQRKPWQPRRKPKESEMAAMDANTTSGSNAAAGGASGAGSRPGESRG